MQTEETIQEQAQERSIEDILKEKYVFICGGAGVGKTFSIMKKAAQNPDWLEKCATTGIAAVNLGDARTINSVLKFFDEKSLEEAYTRKWIHLHLRRLRERKHRIGIDEASMLGAKKLDLIYNAIEDVNMEGYGNELGLVLIGDFCQLPPINEEFAFKAECWEEFDKNVVKLEKVWRQDNSEFVNAINLIRAGRGAEAIPLMKNCGVRFEETKDVNFEGTTLIAVNSEVDVFNAKCLQKLETPLIRVSPTRRGKQTKEWDKLIPYEMRFKRGAYVMILANDVAEWEYVNGDCGIIQDFSSTEDAFYIRLVRTGNVVKIKRIKRYNLQAKQPDQKEFNSMYNPKVDFQTKEWIVGEIHYHPLRLAYASTVHKSQGLSLDRVQIDIKAPFFGYPSMAYVAVSRCRNPESLIIVGSERDFILKCNVDEKVRKWL